jgi:hypothetical protein
LHVHHFLFEFKRSFISSSKLLSPNILLFNIHKSAVGIHVLRIFVQASFPCDGHLLLPDDNVFDLPDLFPEPFDDVIGLRTVHLVHYFFQLRLHLHYQRIQLLYLVVFLRGQELQVGFLSCKLLLQGLVLSGLLVAMLLQMDKLQV